MTDREAFEAWYEIRFKDLCHDVLVDWRRRDANGHYEDAAAWDHWYIWHSAIQHEREACAKVCEECPPPRKPAGGRVEIGESARSAVCWRHPFPCCPEGEPMTDTQTIFAVYACNNYEGGGVVCCFVKEADAAAAMERCNAHQKERPDGMPAVDLPSDGPEWSDYLKRIDEWRERDPLQPGYDWCCDYFAMGPIALHATAATLDMESP